MGLLVTVGEWPLKRFNWYAMPTAIASAFVVQSFWPPVVVVAGCGFVFAAIMGAVYVREFRRAIEQSSPLTKLSMEVQGMMRTDFAIRFVVVQALSGALIILMWYVIAFGLVSIIR